MMIYRGLVVGLLGAIALLLAQQSSLLERSARVRVGAVDARAAAPPPAPENDEPATIVHISRLGTGDDPSDALGLGWREPPIAIDERPIADRWREALRARWRDARPGTYFELTLGGEVRRHMLVLVTR